jgi:hypothetical protein
VLPKDSAIKSENGYGSSSQVPGLSAATAQKAHPAKAAADSSSGSGAAGGSSAAGSGSGSGSGASTGSGTGASGGGGPGPIPQLNARNTASDAPSLTGTYGLVLLIALGGVAAGIAASLAARGSFRQGS